MTTPNNAKLSDIPLENTDMPFSEEQIEGKIFFFFLFKIIYHILCVCNHYQIVPRKGRVTLQMIKSSRIRL